MTWNFLNGKWMRRLTLAGGAIILIGFLLGVAALLVGRYWVIPYMLLQQISAVMEEQWDGPLTIETIHFNWTTPAELQDITLRDAEGREWLHAETVRLTLRDWPGLQPALSEVDIEGLTLKGHIVDGQLRLPLKPMPPRDRENPFINIQAITVRRMSVGIVDNEREITSWSDLQITVRRDNQQYNLEMDQTTSVPGETLHVLGTVERETLEADIQVVVQHTLTSDQMDMALEALKAPLAYQGDGKLALDMDVRVQTADLLSPLDFQISGGATLSDADGREWLHAETVRLTLRDRPGLQMALSELDIEGLTLKGHILDGQLRLPVKPLPPRDRENPFIDIQALTARRLSVGVEDEEGEIASLSDLQITVRRDDQRYNFEMDRATSVPGETLHVRGTVERETLETDIQVVVQHTLTPDQISRALAALKAPLVYQDDGKLAIDMDVRVQTADLPSSLEFQISGGATLSDADGREWLHTETVRLTLREKPGLQLALSEVDIEGLILQGLIVDGQLRLPVKPLPPRENPFIDIQAITVRRLSVGVVDDEREITSWSDLQITVRRDDQRYNFEMDRATSVPGETLQITGTVERETLKLDIKVEVQHTLTPDQVGLALTALQMPFVDQADGKLAIDMHVRGQTEDLLSPMDLEISGVATLTEGNVFLPKGRLIRDLKGEIRFDRQAPTAVAGEWSAVTLQGLARGRLDGQVMDDGTIAYRHRLDAEGISFDEVSRLLSDHTEERRGNILLTTVVEGRTGAPDATQIKGYMYLEDAHLADVPMLTDLLYYVDIDQFDLLLSTDVEATFSVQDLVIILSQARVSNAISAIDVEPGGLVDISNQHLDLYVVLAPIKQLHDLLSEIPLVNLLVDLQDRLIRVRIRGDWNDSIASLLSKEPLRDIGEGTMDFFRGVISTGGRAGRSLYTGFMDLID